MRPALPHSDVRRIPALDGLRGVAVVLVLIHHFTGNRDGAGFVDAALARVGNAGWIGVDLFFVLSGFLITGLLLEARATRSHYFRTFYLRRALRIFPLYFLYLAVVFGVALIVLPNDWRTALLVRSRWLYLTYTANLAIPRQDEVWPLWTGHLWSLCVEEQFYMVWPAVVWFLGARRLHWICVGLFLAAVLIRVWSWRQGVPAIAIYNLTFTRMDGLAAGAFVAVAARDPHGVGRWSAASRWVACGTMSALVILFGKYWGPFPYLVRAVSLFGLPLLAISFASILLALLSGDSRLRRQVERPSIVWLGRVSYGLYIWHFGFMGVLRSYGMKPVDGLLAWNLVYLVVGIVVSLILADLSMRFIEAPFLRLKDRLRLANTGIRTPATTELG